MRAQLNDDSEDEYLDDPIKLFDFEQERVQFGTQPLHCSNTGAIPNQYEDSPFIENNIDLSETDGTDIKKENFCASDCRPSRVKLVDCGKYPWYYKKYSQQILNKLNIYNLVSDDDDSEEDVSSENSDCIVVDDIIDQVDQNIKDYSSNILPEIICKTWSEKRQETMKFKEDIEIQIALSLKNTSEVDLKRNKGLIGIKITQKLVTDNDENIEMNKKNKETKITTTPKDIISKTDDEIKNKKSKADDVVKNLPVQFNLGKMSEKLLEKITSKKNSVQPRENKPKPNKLNKNNDKKKSAPKANTCKSSSLPNQVKGLTVHRKETTNTNHVKSNEKLLSRLTVPHTNEKETQKVEQEIDLNKNSPKKHVEDKGEPNSPILPCTSTNNLAKKKLADNKDAKKILHKMQSANNDIGQLSGNVETYTKSFTNDKCSDKDPKKNLHKMQSVDNNIGQLGESVETYMKSFSNDKCSGNDPKMNNDSQKMWTYTKSFINDKCSGNDPKMNNDTQKIDQPNVNRIVQSSVDRGASVTFGGTGNDIRTTFHYAPTSTSSAVHPQFKPATNDCSKTATFTNDLKSNDTSPDNIKSHNNTVQNSYGSAIILRPMIPVRAQSNHHIFKLQPRFYQNPHAPNYNRPPFQIPDHRSNFRSANFSTANYRFPTLQNIRYPIQYYSQGVQHGHNSGFQHNLPHWFQKGSEQHKSYPYPPRPVQESSLNIKSVLDPQSSNISQSNNNIVHNSNIDLAKKKTSDPRMLPHDSVDPDLIVSKTKMLEVLDSATKKLDNDIAEKNFTERVQQPVSKQKIPNVASSKLDLTNKGDYDKLMELQRDYNKNLITHSNSELVAKKGQILEKISNDLKRGINAVNSEEKVQELANKFKRPKINQVEQAKEDHRKKIEQAGGYSPPILPIPTFQNILHRVKKDVQKQDQLKMKTKSVSSVINVKQINYNVKTMQKNTPKGSNTGRKISIEEYKKRTLQMNRNEFKNSNNNVCRKSNDKNDPNLQIKRKYNVDRCSTDTDLGYDSDSTVIL